MTIIEEIETINGSSVLVLSPELLAEMGLATGDKVEITRTDRTLTVRPVEADEDREFDEIAEQLMAERKHVYEALARGAE
jgi:antitoxin component of MazEF toxin-antitoxin module